LAGPLGFMQVEEFKISLPVVAAFLTLVGYSANDTIVIFDRIREIRGKSPYLTPQMINDSVNQTLSRTIITGGLTLMVVVVLYFFGGSGIHAFAFSLVVGVIAGSYSTVFIAAPLLLWLLGKKETQPGNVAARQMAKSV
ncbi:MAG: protein translocase subunit SecDF, partial [Pirellulaceae bacterium]